LVCCTCQRSASSSCMYFTHLYLRGFVLEAGHAVCCGSSPVFTVWGIAWCVCSVMRVGSGVYSRFLEAASSSTIRCDILRPSMAALLVVPCRVLCPCLSVCCACLSDECATCSCFPSCHAPLSGMTVQSCCVLAWGVLPVCPCLCPLRETTYFTSTGFCTAY
jgi:hypothetical protein